jgi:hypothetical protein
MGLEYDPVVLGSVDLNSKVGKIKWRVKAPEMLAKIKYKCGKYRKNLSEKEKLNEKMREMKRRIKVMVSDMKDGNLGGYRGGQEKN